MRVIRDADVFRFYCVCFVVSDSSATHIIRLHMYIASTSMVASSYCIAQRRKILEIEQQSIHNV